MDWLEDIQSNRRRQVENLYKSFGASTFDTLEKAVADNDDVEEARDEEASSEVKNNNLKKGEKSDMYKMRLLGLRKFNGQDQKEYIGIEDTDNSYIANHENGDIVIAKTQDGYLVSKFPIDLENNDGEEEEASTLSEAIDVALRYKEDLDAVEDPEEAMYNETNKAQDEDDNEEEVNPFELAAWEAEQEEVAKAYEALELDEFEKAKHQDGDIHPNGKWVWRASANGGKGDWRVAKPSRVGGSSKTTSSASNKKTEGATKKVPSSIKIEQKTFRIKDGKIIASMYDTQSRISKVTKFAKENGLEVEWAESKNNTVTHDINGTKVTVTKNSDGSYTLEANGKKVKSDDPSFFVFGKAIKPRVKNALAKIVGLETKKINI